MRLVVADTSPIFYLLCIEQTSLLPKLFGKVFVPDAVFSELCHPSAPPALRDWIAQPPDWLEVASVNPGDDETLAALGAGERCSYLRADLLLIDERKGTTAALKKGLGVTGTLGILRAATQRGLIDLADCFQKLKRTNFRYRQDVLDSMLAEFE